MDPPSASSHQVVLAADTDAVWQEEGSSPRVTPATAVRTTRRAGSSSSSIAFPRLCLASALCCARQPVYHCCLPLGQLPRTSRQAATHQTAHGAAFERELIPVILCWLQRAALQNQPGSLKLKSCYQKKKGKGGVLGGFLQCPNP